VQNQASVLGAKNDVRLNRAFEFNKQGQVEALRGIDPELRSAPTIADIAARFPRYINNMTSEQQTAMIALRRDLEPYRQLFDETVSVPVPGRATPQNVPLVDVGTRPDIIEGGFYVPRGRAGIEGADEPIKLAGTAGRGTRIGAEQAAIFNSQADGIAAGFEYAPIGDVLTSHINQSGRRATDAFVANFFKNVGGGTTPKMRMFQQNAPLVQAHAALRRNIDRLNALAGRLSTKQQAAVDSFLDDPNFEDIDSIISAFNVKVTRGTNAGGTLPEINAQAREVRKQLQAMAPAWKSAQKRARKNLRDEAVIQLPGLEGRAFPDEVANAANKILVEEGPAKGKLAPISNTIDAYNNLYRGFRATLDNSALGIQGLLGLANDQKAYKAALGVNFRAWQRGGDAALGRFLVDFDDATKAASRLSADTWGRSGLRVGGAGTEFQLGGPGTIGQFVERIPGIRQANRAFGFFGDSLRLQWADDELAALMRQTGKAADELLQDGSVESLARTINGATGWSPSRTGGPIGDLVLFAPRFLQSRLETAARAGLSLRPGATLEQRMARRYLLKLIGYGTMVTFAANEALGNDTDVRPFVKGRPNPNFMRIRFGGQDWSVFGTWDSLAKAIMVTAQGKPEQALRTMSSGIVANSWEWLSHEDFEGRRVDLRGDPLGFGEWIFRSHSPFAFQELPFAAKQLAGGDPAGLATVFGEAAGVKATPLTGTERFSGELFGQEFDDLEPHQQRAVSKQFPGRNRELAEIYVQTDTNIDGLLQTAQMLEQQGLPRNDIRRFVNEQYNSLRDQAWGATKQLLGLDDERRNIADLDSPDPGRRARAEYQEIINEHTVGEPGSEFIMWDAVDAAVNRKLTSRQWTKEQHTGIIRNQYLSRVPFELVDKYFYPSRQKRILDANNARIRHLKTLGLWDELKDTYDETFIPGAQAGRR